MDEPKQSILKNSQHLDLRKESKRHMASHFQELKTWSKEHSLRYVLRLDSGYKATKAPRQRRLPGAFFFVLSHPDTYLASRTRTPPIHQRRGI
jgi:hypothetical protein